MIFSPYVKQGAQSPVSISNLHQITEKSRIFGIICKNPGISVEKNTGWL
jgi:hypothetical protein